MKIKVYYTIKEGRVPTKCARRIEIDPEDYYAIRSNSDYQGKTFSFPKGAYNIRMQDFDDWDKQSQKELLAYDRRYSHTERVKEAEENGMTLDEYREYLDRQQIIKNIQKCEEEIEYYKEQIKSSQEFLEKLKKELA